MRSSTRMCACWPDPSPSCACTPSRLLVRTLIMRTRTWRPPTHARLALTVGLMFGVVGSLCARGRDEKSTFQNILHEEVYFPRPPTPALRKKFHISSEAKASGTAACPYSNCNVPREWCLQKIVDHCGTHTDIGSSFATCKTHDARHVAKTTADDRVDAAVIHYLAQ